MSNDVILKLPDTKLAREADGILKAALSPAVWNHSLRSFLLGRACGLKKGLTFDEEGFYLAALFHDLGLCSKDINPRLPFQKNGSLKLNEFLKEKGVAAERITPLVEAIDFHMQLFPRWKKGNVAGLLHMGAWTDLTFRNRISVWSEARVIGKAYGRKAIDLKFPLMLMGSMRSVPACTGILFP